MSRLLVILLLVVSGLSPAVAQEPLSLQAVLASSRQFYPKVLQGIEKLRGREGRQLAADGAFDWKVTQESLMWANGFYDGVSADQKIVKPLAGLGADVFAGYRVTDGDFPVYQDELVTLSGGEFNFGVVFSLLQDRDFDQRRFNLRNTALATREAELSLLLTRVLVQRDAMKSYWNWLAAGQRLGVYQELLDLALAHNQALEKRVAAGDLARIYLVESQQNILKRKALFTREERDFINAALKLTLFYRDSVGKPAQAEQFVLPEEMPAVDALIARSVDAEVAALDDRQVQLSIIDRQIEAERNRVRLGENALLPTFDVGVKAAHDLGRGSRSRDEFDLIFELRFEVPLERSKARGDLVAARARLQELTYERQLLREQLTAKMRQLAQAVETAVAYAAITELEFQQAEKLARAEWTRFQEGASDFFLLNLREERTAEARIRNIDAMLSYHLAVAEYYAVTVDLAAFELD